MENIVLIVLLLIALALIGVVLLQRSEGGGLGIGGGGGGGGGLVSGRGAANALTKATWALGAAFMVCCILLTVMQTRALNNDSVIERLGTGGDLLPPASTEPLLPPGLEGGSLLPPTSGDAPALPPIQE
ncbi:MAG: preprotein translocase subunit SecG [Pseudomonadota bacterium]